MRDRFWQPRTCLAHYGNVKRLDQADAVAAVVASHDRGIRAARPVAWISASCDSCQSSTAVAVVQFQRRILPPLGSNLVDFDQAIARAAISAFKDRGIVARKD